MILGWETLDWDFLIDGMRGRIKVLEAIRIKEGNYGIVVDTGPGSQRKHNNV